MLKKLDFKYIILMAALFVGCFFSYVYSIEIFSTVELFFEFPYLNIIAGTLATVITVLHKIKTRKFTFSASMSFNEFRIPVEDILSFIGSPITIVGSLSLAKGIYLQTAKNIKYFPFVENSVQLLFIGVVAAYLIFISVMELGKKFHEIILRRKTSDDPITPILQSEVKDEVPSVK